MVTISVEWKDKMRFKGKADPEHTVVMDAGVEGANKGATPMEILLMALGGCTGMDVVSILRKMHTQFDQFEIEIRGEKTEEHPRIYKKIELVYKFKGEEIKEENVEKAVRLSQEKYCSVSAMLRKSAEVTHRIEIER
jgi:Predicted redox protein, regulator of disulfide bond formation